MIARSGSVEGMVGSLRLYGSELTGNLSFAPRLPTGLSLRVPYKKLLTHYRANSIMLARFCRARTDRARADVVAAAHRHPLTTEPLLEALTRNATRLRNTVRSTY